MKAEMTIDDLRAVVAEARKHAIPVRIVKTEREAAILTQNDPLGRHWRVGDGYYSADDMRGTMAAPDDTCVKE